MTTALCFNCGETKFGAICQCEKCGAGPIGNMDLDILFSDHNMSVDDLEKFGKVIKSINEVTDDPKERFYTFMHYVHTRRPELVGADIKESLKERAMELLSQANLPGENASSLGDVGEG